MTCRYAITLVDSFSKWPEIYFCDDVTSATVIRFLIDVFSREGLPSEIVTDHGPQFASREFSQYLNECDIKHVYSAIYNPRANGAVERFNSVVKETSQWLSAQKKPFKSGITEFLTVYRATPHATTNISPSELLHNCRFKTKLDAQDFECNPCSVDYS